MERENLEKELNAHQKRVIAHRRRALVYRRFCGICRTFTIHDRTGKQWVCRSCGY